jgi:glycosyltransferase involved in cell wall biosynthesis
MIDYSIHIVDSLSTASGGPARSISSLVYGALDRRIRVFVLEASFFPSKHHISLPKGCIHIRGFGNCLLTYASLRMNRQYRNQTSVSHIHGIWDVSITIFHFLLLIIGPRPVLLHTRGMLEPWSLKNRFYKKLIFRIFLTFPLLRRSDYIVVSTPEEKSSVENALGDIRGTLLVSPNALLPLDSNPCNDSVSQEYFRAHAPSADIIFCFVSRIHPKKGLHLLLAAWKILIQNQKQCHLFIAGPVALQDHYYYSELCDLYDIPGSDTITYLGELPIAQKDKLLDFSDFLVLPSFSENFANIIPEAMRMGCIPIISEDLPWSSAMESSICLSFKRSSRDIYLSLLQAIELHNHAQSFSNAQLAAKMFSSRYSPCSVVANLYGMIPNAKT